MANPGNGTENERKVVHKTLDKETIDKLKNDAGFMKTMYEKAFSSLPPPTPPSHGSGSGGGATGKQKGSSFSSHK